ncbi:MULTISPECIES: VirB6/TrbL-like conjugal transfer protein, CD1112 family [Bifidobacterium]|nr:MULTISPECIES: CD0415/CD1112 family protein [Bifidobacterium]QOL31448.1 type IV secretion system protein [Bifidobacterium eulemuris]QOL33829.1 type IV secretion system protein [Bifidobacterium lemurum]
MLNMIGGGGLGSNVTNLLTASPDSWNPTLYQLALSVHSVVVKPLTSVILAIMFTLELSRNSTRIESDRELGVKIVAGTLFKVALVLLAAQNADLFLRAFNSISSWLVTGVSDQMSADTTATGNELGDQMRDQISDAGVMGQAALLILLLIPFLLSQLASVIATVVMYVRFIEIYALTAFQSLPFALLIHDDTKPIAIGYFKAYARTCINAVTLLICLAIYQAIVADAVGLSAAEGDMVGWVTGHFAQLLMASVLLFFVIQLSQRVSRAVAGE